MAICSHWLVPMVNVFLKYGPNPVSFCVYFRPFNNAMINRYSIPTKIGPQYALLRNVLLEGIAKNKSGKNRSEQKYDKNRGVIKRINAVVEKDLKSSVRTGRFYKYV